jgi:hypothetical protein
MKPNILVDFHHSSLLRSLVMLFEDRLGMNLYRPIGMEWWSEGFWGINDQSDTANQFLSINSQPIDNTPPLNAARPNVPGLYTVRDPGGGSHHIACTLEYFKKHKFDYIVASIPAHVPLFKKLIAEHQPDAKLIIQQGNNWNIEYPGENILASRSPQIYDGQSNVIYYHQEFDTKHRHWLGGLQGP